MKMRLFRLIVILLLSVGSIISIILVEGKSTNTENHLMLKEEENSNQQIIKSVIRNSGWIVSNWINGQSIDSKVESINNIMVEKKTLPTKKNTTFKMETFFLRTEGSIEIFSKECDVDKLISYEIKGKIFAYQVDLVPVSVQENRRERTGALIPTFFIDNNGDGIFEERYFSLKLEKIPDWARN